MAGQEQEPVLEIYDPEDSRWHPVKCVELVVVPIGMREQVSSYLFGEFVKTAMSGLIPRFSELKGYETTTTHASTESESRDIILRKATNTSVCAVIIPVTTIQIPGMVDMGMGVMRAAIAVLTSIPEGKGPHIAIAEGGGKKGLQAIRDLIRLRPTQSSGCFIATVTCGADSEEVAILRHFRDNMLLRSELGRIFVRGYYRVSPVLASWIEGSPGWRLAIRWLLVSPIAGLVRRLNSSSSQRHKEP